jgi:glycosyltransferase involved in cell wall biosynthesis
VTGSSPKISIITVCFNAEKFIERTIKSVISQTYPNIEYIIIDGKSKDRTVEVIKKYESKISRWISEPDRGIYDAMNKGLRAATGDYVWFLNAGDRISGERTVKEIILQSNNEDLIYGDAERVDEEGNSRGWHKKTPAAEQLSAKSFLNGMVLCHQSMIVKRSVAPEYSLEWMITGDIDWAIRIMMNVKSKKYINSVFCRFLDGGISSARRKKALRERFDVLRKYYGFLPTLLAHLKFGFQAVRRGSIS